MSASRRGALPPTDASIILATSAVSGLDDPPPPDTPEGDTKSPAEPSAALGSASARKAPQRRSQGRKEAPAATPPAEPEPESTPEAVPAQPDRPQFGPLAWLEEPDRAMDDIELRRWQTLLNADAGKLGRTLKQARVDWSAWVRTVQDARAAGIDDDTVEAAARRVSVPVPDRTIDQD